MSIGRYHAPVRSAPLGLLLALALPAPAVAATPPTPPILATKALRVELPGTEEALWRFVPRSGAPAQAFAPPVSPLDGRLVVEGCDTLDLVRDLGALRSGLDARRTFPREVVSREVA